MIIDTNAEIYLDNGKKISGHLSGSTKLWWFASTNDYFIELYPSGKFSNMTMYVLPPKKEHREMFDKICVIINNLGNITA